MTTATQGPIVTDEQAAILALHAQVVQGGFSTPEIERERLLADAASASDPQAFINETVGKFAVEVFQAGAAQAQAAQQEPAPKAEVIKPETFTYEGERIELDPSLGHELLAEYRAAAAVLHEAKARAKAVEQRIMQALGGHEHGAINGQDMFHWTFCDSTSFDVTAFKNAGPEYKALYDHFLKTKPTRRFKVDGTVGVD